jgi:tripartite-type tricarboxylate transporter receptor subunit TctC
VLRRFAGFATVALSLIAIAATASAQQYPSRNVTIIVPYPSGGPTDETARVVAQSLSTQLGQSFIVEDVSGGGAIIGAEKVAHAIPDGYTLLIHNLQISANVSLNKMLPFDTIKAFAPVMLLNRNPLVLVGRNTLVPNTLEDLIALMKRQRLKAAVPGYGTTGHLTTNLLAQEAGVSLDQIRYRGAAPALTDLLGEQIDLCDMCNLQPTSLWPVRRIFNHRRFAASKTRSRRAAFVAMAPPCQSRVTSWR